MKSSRHLSNQESKLLLVAAAGLIILVAVLLSRQGLLDQLKTFALAPVEAPKPGACYYEGIITYECDSGATDQTCRGSTQVFIPGEQCKIFEAALTETVVADCAGKTDEEIEKLFNETLAPKCLKKINMDDQGECGFGFGYGIIAGPSELRFNSGTSCALQCGIVVDCVPVPVASTSPIPTATQSVASTTPPPTTPTGFFNLF